MAKAKLKLQKRGRTQIQDAASGMGTYYPQFFQVGSLAGFAATDTEAVARGTLNYTGGADLVQQRRLDDQTSRIVLTLPEGVGPFEVGNILLFTQGQDDAAPVPFASIILPFVIVKRAGEIDAGTVGLPNPGNRLLVNITLVHQVLEAGEDVEVNVEVVAPEYANLAFFDNEYSVPAANLNPWKQFIIVRTNQTGGPALVTKINDTDYWAQPFMRDLRHPQYGVLSGGSYGDGYRERPYSWVWGQRYTTPSAAFRGPIGGRAYKNSRQACGVAIGGRPYKE